MVTYTLVFLAICEPQHMVYPILGKGNGRSPVYAVCPVSVGADGLTRPSYTILVSSLQLDTSYSIVRYGSEAA